MGSALGLMPWSAGSVLKAVSQACGGARDSMSTGGHARPCGTDYAGVVRQKRRRTQLIYSGNQDSTCP